jgi:hypothetical protein
LVHITAAILGAKRHLLTVNVFHSNAILANRVTFTDTVR